MGRIYQCRTKNSSQPAKNSSATYKSQIPEKIDTILFTEFKAGLKTLYDTNLHVFIGKVVDVKTDTYFDTLYIQTERIYKDSLSLIKPLMKVAKLSLGHGDCTKPAITFKDKIYIGAFGAVAEPISQLNLYFTDNDNFYIENDSVMSGHYPGFKMPLSSLDAFWGTRSNGVIKITRNISIPGSTEDQNLYDFFGRKISNNTLSRKNTLKMGGTCLAVRKGMLVFVNFK